jgi:hypothetical protein
MPPLEQIKRVLLTVEPDIAQRPYPVYIMDYKFHFWMVNSATAKLQGDGVDHLHKIMARGIDGLRMSFDSRLLFAPDLHDSAPVERETVFRFKAYNLYRRHEPFYLAYPECMQEHLLPADYARFVQRWNEVDVHIQDVYPLTPQMIKRTGSEVLVFDVHMVDILHLDRLLFAAYYEPKDDGAGNRERCAAYFARYSPKKKCCVRVWDFWENSTALSTHLQTQLIEP